MNPLSTEASGVYDLLMEVQLVSLIEWRREIEGRETSLGRLYKKDSVLWLAVQVERESSEDRKEEMDKG